MGGAANSIVITSSGKRVSAMGYCGGHINFAHAALYWAHKGDWKKAEEVALEMIEENAKWSAGSYYDRPNAGFAPVWYGFVVVDFEKRMILSATQWANLARFTSYPSNTEYQNKLIECGLYELAEYEQHALYQDKSPFDVLILDPFKQELIYEGLKQMYSFSEAETALWEEWVYPER